MIGQTISHYKIVEKLGEGGMGVVYKAEDLKLRRFVALKFLPPHCLPGDADRQRFSNEAHTAARLSHINICTIFEIDTVEGQTFIAMEHIQGEDLAAKVAAGPLDFNEAASIALDLCSALREAHGAEIIHRDVKPSNVMISIKGRTVLLDFGLARLKSHPQLTRTGTTVGTFAYMSPEQIRGGEVDHRTDIWSLGVVLYQMLTGYLPFKADHEAALLYAITHEEPEPVSKTRPNVPAGLEAIVKRALAKDPSQRYPNADALQADLEVFVGKQEGKTVPLSVRLGVEEVRRRRLVRGVWVALLVAAASAVVWFWPRERSTEPKPTAVATRPGPTAEARRSSIAVLPLGNLSGEEENEFFVDGMTEELITQLAQIKALKVISRTSIMQYKNVSKRATDIAEELDVANILEGSVLWAGDRVRISVQLVDGSTDEHLWAQSYESDLSDVLGLQRRVAGEVARKIKVELTDEEQSRLGAAPVVDKRAYELYLRGRYHWSKRTPEGNRRAIGFYEQALRIDPGYALAYAGLAETYVVAATWSYLPTGVAGPKAREMAEKALSIDPDLASAHAVLGLVAEYCDWDWDTAEKHLERAIELNPSDATSRQWYAQLLNVTGRRAEAAAQARIATELDPLSISVNGVAGMLLAYNGEFDAAKALFEKIRDLDPESAPLYFYQYAYYELMGEHEKAARATIRHLELVAETDRERSDLVAVRQALDEGGVVAFQREMVTFLKRRDEGGRMIAYYVAVFFVQLGEVDSAFAWLERAYERREGMMPQVAADEMLVPLRSDPRYLDLLARMKLPPPSTVR